ncbi:MAG: hypothetical protein ACYSWO_26590 [Planctomycetota bacterium]|jgi:hypothetical protein
MTDRTATFEIKAAATIRGTFYHDFDRGIVVNTIEFDPPRTFRAGEEIRVSFTLTSEK